MLRWLVYLLLLLGVAYIGLRLWVREVSTPDTPRPLFHEWEERDQGWKWASDGALTDQSGNWVFCDKTLNMLAVIATGDPQFTGSLNFFEPTHAVIHARSPHETRVDAVENSLIIVIPGKTRGQFHIEKDFAERLYVELWGASVKNVIAEILERYQGTDDSSLASFAAEHCGTHTPHTGGTTLPGEP